MLALRRGGALRAGVVVGAPAAADEHAVAVGGVVDEAAAGAVDVAATTLELLSK